MFHPEWHKARWQKGQGWWESDVARPKWWKVEWHQAKVAECGVVECGVAQGQEGCKTKELGAEKRGQKDKMDRNGWQSGCGKCLGSQLLGILSGFGSQLGTIMSNMSGSTTE